MTDSEKRLQAAMLLLEHQEAENHLAALRERAKRHIDVLEAAKTWLTLAQCNEPAGDRLDINARQRRADHAQRITEEKYRESLDVDALLKLANDIAEARRRVDELAQRKEDLGLR